MVNLAAKGMFPKRCSQMLGHPRALAFVTPAVKQHGKTRAIGQRVCQFAKQVGATVLVDRHMLNVLKTDTRRIQAVADGLGWEASPVFDTAETLLFRSSDHLAVTQKAGG